MIILSALSLALSARVFPRIFNKIINWEKNERLPSSNEVEKKDKWVRRNVHFLENDDVEQISKEQDDDRMMMTKTATAATTTTTTIQREKTRRWCRWNIEKVRNENCRLMWTNRRLPCRFSSRWYDVRWNRKKCEPRHQRFYTERHYKQQKLYDSLETENWRRTSDHEKTLALSH